MACQEECLSYFAKIVVLKAGKASFICNLIASSFLITLTSVVLRNQFLKVTPRSQKYHASMHLSHVCDAPAQSS